MVDFIVPLSVSYKARYFLSRRISVMPRKTAISVEYLDQHITIIHLNCQKHVFFSEPSTGGSFKFIHSILVVKHWSRPLSTLFKKKKDKEKKDK